MNDLDIDNLFSVTLRDAGQVALIDGDTYEIVNVLDTGYAVHFPHLGVGRYLYVIGRDAKVDLIDLWMDPPQIVATVKIGLEARSVETSSTRAGRSIRDRRRLLAAAIRHHGRHARAAQDRLDPRHDGGHPGVPRAAGRLDRGLATAPSSSSMSRRPGTLLVTTRTSTTRVTDIGTERFTTTAASTAPALLPGRRQRASPARRDRHQGGPARGLIESEGLTPHPGRGANFVHPKYGPVWATSHLGDETISLVGTDPEGIPTMPGRWWRRSKARVAGRCSSRPTRTPTISTSTPRSIRSGDRQLGRRVQDRRAREAG